MKRIFIAFLFFISVVSCAQKKEVSKAPVYQPKATQNTPAVTDSIKAIYKGAAVNKKINFNIAFLLPFGTESIIVDSFLSTIPSESSMAAELYEGALMAFDSLKKQGLSFTVYTYDTKQDTFELKEILRKPHMTTMDLIIGPVYNNPLRVAAEFAKKNKIPLISPLSPADNITENNPFFILANATLKTHAEQMVNYIHKAHTIKKIVILHEDKPISNIISGYFQQANKGYSKDSILTLKTISNALISQNLITNGPNYILVPSFDEAYINSVLIQLNQLAGKYDIRLYGMPTWENFESLRIDYLQNLNLHYTTSFWENINEPEIRAFQKQYLEEYKTFPTRYAFTGYDLTLYFGELMLEYGSKFSTEIDRQSKTGLHQMFNFKPVRNCNECPVRFFENKFVHILRLENLMLTKIN